VAVVLRDGVDRDTVVRTACDDLASTSTHRRQLHAPASPTSSSSSSSSGVIYRSTSNRLQIHAATTASSSVHRRPAVVANDQHWTPYILEYACKLHLTARTTPSQPYETLFPFSPTLLPSLCLRGGSKGDGKESCGCGRFFKVLL